MLAGCATRLRPPPRLRPCQTLTHSRFLGFSGLAWITGDLVASRAVLATAHHDDPDRADYGGRSYACVQGSVQAPRVQTWFMHLGHLNWREGSGAELREDEVYAGREHLWKTDPVWLRSNGIE